MKLPSGWIIRPIVDRTGITLKQSDLVLCGDCKWWQWRISDLQGRCEYHGFESPYDWFCATGEEGFCATREEEIKDEEDEDNN